MIPPEQRAEIRRLYYAEHWRVGTIATSLGLHHDTVRHAIDTERFLRPGTQIRPSALDPYKPFLLLTLEQYPRLRAARLHAMIRERAYAGSPVQVRRWVHTVRPAARAEAYLRLETLPGEQAQVDWGNFGAIQIGRARRTLACFVLCCRGPAPSTPTSPWTRRWRVSCAATSRPSLRSVAYRGRSSTTISRASSSTAPATTSGSMGACSSWLATITSPPSPVPPTGATRRARSSG